MNISTQVQLQQFNTLNLHAVAAELIRIQHQNDIAVALAHAKQQQRDVLLLSGGSNLLLPEQIDAVVLHMQIKGIRVLSEDQDRVQVHVAAGEIWHDFVLWSTQQGYYGLQNLALIPGLVGASPVQNIGAYGVEVGEFIHSVEVYDRALERFAQIAAKDCLFSYRDSVFKQQPDRYMICGVIFELLKKPNLKINYGDLKAAMGDDLSPENLQRQVIQIRQSKLPDPQDYPNVGSFFKNPVISTQQYQQYFAHIEQVPHYPQPNDQIKVAAGWLIEQAGWKGKRLGQVGMFHKQALVLVNYADATLSDVQRTYNAVQQDVQDKFGLRLQPEPVLINQAGTIQSHMECA